MTGDGIKETSNVLRNLIAATLVGILILAELGSVTLAGWLGTMVLTGVGLYISHPWVRVWEGDGKGGFDP